MLVMIIVFSGLIIYSQISGKIKSSAEGGWGWGYSIYGDVTVWYGDLDAYQYLTVNLDGIEPATYKVDHTTELNQRSFIFGQDDLVDGRYKVGLDFKRDKQFFIDMWGENFQPYLLSKKICFYPQWGTFTFYGSYGPIHWNTFQKPFVNGVLKDKNGRPLIGYNVTLYRADNLSDLSKRTQISSVKTQQKVTEYYLPGVGPNQDGNINVREDGEYQMTCLVEPVSAASANSRWYYLEIRSPGWLSKTQWTPLFQIPVPGLTRNVSWTQ